MNLTTEIKHKALESGFDLVGVTDALPIESGRIEIFRCWLESGFAGQMDYLRRDIERRFNPAEFVQNAQSVIVTGLNYKPPKNKFTLPPQKTSTGKIVSYAQYEDYHAFMEKQLHKLIDFIKSKTGQETRYKICVDSSPLAERTLAAKSGLGFIGKNQMLINPVLGCQILLGEIITDLNLQPDKPISQNCSNCKKCIESCPTGALMPNGQFDANKCINYLTIEYKGEIPPETAVKIENRLFGCEDCILACPYHNRAPDYKNKQFKHYQDRAEFDLQEIITLSEKSFNEKFFDSPIKRTGIERLKRNARICLENIKKAGDKNTG